MLPKLMLDSTFVLPRLELVKDISSIFGYVVTLFIVIKYHQLKIIKFIVQSTGDLVSGQIQIQVSFSPKIISLQKSSIKTGQGLIAEITCTVTGEPKPKVTWYKGDEVIIPIRMVFLYF